MLITEQLFAVLPLEVLQCDASPMPSQPPPTEPMSRVILPARRESALVSGAVSRDRRRRKPQSKTAVFSSPFKDCLEDFGNLTGPRYCRPVDGKVNGYIKFRSEEHTSELQSHS